MRRSTAGQAPERVGGQVEFEVSDAADPFVIMAETSGRTMELSGNRLPLVRLHITFLLCILLLCLLFPLCLVFLIRRPSQPGQLRQ